MLLQHMNMSINCLTSHVICTDVCCQGRTWLEKNDVCLVLQDEKTPNKRMTTEIIIFCFVKHQPKFATCVRAMTRTCRVTHKMSRL